MNSVIQQLYMIPSIRNGILAIEGTGSDVDDDMSGDEKQDNEVNVSFFPPFLFLIQTLFSLRAGCTRTGPVGIWWDIKLESSDAGYLLDLKLVRFLKYILIDF